MPAVTRSGSPWFPLLHLCCIWTRPAVLDRVLLQHMPRSVKWEGMEREGRDGRCAEKRASSFTPTLGGVSIAPHMYQARWLRVLLTRHGNTSCCCRSSRQSIISKR
eukprot:354470-Chlamydomonas_euryale.AAC.28